MSEIFEIIVFSYNGEVPCIRTTHKIYGRNIATNTATEIGECDNVRRVEMINGTTGELVLAIEDGEKVWESTY